MKILAILALFVAMDVSAQVHTAWDHLVKNRHEQARPLFQEYSGDLGRIGWFLTFTGNGPTEELKQAALQILNEAPDSPAAQFVLHWMEPYRECIGDWVEQAVASIGERNPENPELKALYANLLRADARARDGVPDFRLISERAGFVTQWKFAEKFGAYPVPAFHQSWPTDQASGWKNEVSHQSRTGVIIPPRQVYGPGVLYAYSEFENPAKQDVVIRTFSYQNLTLFINGETVITMPALEDLGPRIRRFSLRLEPGKHEIVVKTTQTREKDGQFSIQITAPKPVSFPKPGLPSLDLQNNEPTPNFVQTPLAATIAASTSDLANLIRAFLAKVDRDKQAHHSLLEPIYQRNQESQLVGGMLASLYLDFVPYLPRQEQFANAYQILGRLYQNPDGHHLDNIMSLASLLVQANQTQQALDLMDQVLEANPGYCGAIEARLAISARESLLDQREQTIQLLETMGDNHRWALKKRLEEARREGNLEETSALVKRLAALLPWDGYIAQKHNMNEDYQAAIDDLSKRREIFPLQDYYPYAIAEAHGRLGEHGEQRQWLEKTLKVNPSNRDAILDLVNLDSMEGKRDQAIKRLRDYLNEEPADAAFRQRLSHLEGASAFERFRVDPMTVIEEAKNKPISEGADSELLLDQLMVRLFPDGSQMRYTHLVTRVLTKDGVDEEGELQLPSDLEILELRTIKADGTIFYPESFENKNTLSLSGIGIGDFIDEEHIEYLPPAFYDPNGLDANMTFIFQGVDRIYHHSELVLIYPEDLDPEPVLLERNMPSPPEIEIKDGFKTIRWLTKDMPPLKIEPNMPQANYFQPTASFYYNTSHAEIRDFYLNVIQQRIALSDRLLAKLDEWRAAEEDPRKLAENIYREVTSAITPSRNFFQDVNLTWETGEGNATLLVYALYRELGLDVDVVLSRAAQVERYIFDTPLPSAWPYVLMRLEHEGETIWLDGNHSDIAFGYIPFSYRGAKALVLNPDKENHVTVPSFDDQDERIETHYAMDINPDGSVVAKGSEKFFGLFSSQLKERYAALNRPETRQRVEAGINRTFAGAEVTQVDITEDLPVGEFELTNRFTMPQLGSLEDDVLKIPFPLPPSPLLERYGKLATRTTPIAINRPNLNVATLELTLPQGFTWDNDSEVRRKDSKYGYYEISVERADDQSLTLKRSYHLKSQLVMPEDYEDFLEFCRSMLENEDLMLNATKGAGAP